MVKDFKVSETFTAKAGKYGSFTESVAREMIESGAAEEVVSVSSMHDILNKGPKIYVEPKPKTNPTQEKQKAAEKPEKDKDAGPKKNKPEKDKKSGLGKQTETKV